MRVMSDHVHTLPASEAGRHSSDRLPCACHPTYYRMCQPCDGEKGHDCWACGGQGWIAIPLHEAEARAASGEALHVIHQELWRQ